MADDVEITERRFKFVAACLIANFVVFFVVAMYIGGDALNGYQADGRYFLGSHGNYREVTYAVWSYSAFHAIVTLLSGFSFVVSALVWKATKAR